VASYVSSPAGRTKLLIGAATALVVTAGVLLAFGSFLGLYVRPTSDDWCGAWKTRDLGVFGIGKDYYNTQNGRVANALLTGVVYSHGLFGPKVLPVALVISLTLALALTALDLRAPVPVVLAVVLVIEMLLFYAGTRPYQVLLWAPATISHTLPGVLAVWSGLVAVAAGRRGGRAATWASVGFAVFMGMVIGTLSEPFTVVSGVFVATAGVLLLVPRLRASTWYPFAWCAGWCAGLIAGFTLLYTSPGARWRRAQMPPAGSPVSPRNLRAEFHDWLHVWHSVATTWAYLAAPAAGLLLGLVLSGRQGPDSSWAVRGSRAWTRTLLALPVPLVALSSFGVVVGLRQGYGAAGWTYGRAWTNFLLPMLLALAVYGVLLGRLAARRLAGAAEGGAAEGPWGAGRAPVVLLLGAAATVTCVAAAIHLEPVVRDLGADAVVRAVAWDKQDTRIREEVARGATVVKYRPVRAPALAEPFFTRDYAKDWVAQCVSHWYGVTRITR
jgi:hypothetical protein